MSKEPQSANSTKTIGYLMSVICGSFFLLGVGTLAGIATNLSPNVGRASARAFFVVLSFICLCWCAQSLWAGVLEPAQCLVLLAVVLTTYVMRSKFVVPHSVGADEKSL